MKLSFSSPLCSYNLDGCSNNFFIGYRINVLIIAVVGTQIALESCFPFFPLFCQVNWLFMLSLFDYFLFGHFFLVKGHPVFLLW